MSLLQNCRSSVLFLTVLTLAYFLCGCTRKPHHELIVGMELAYPPFEMTDPQSRPAGVSVDLAHALGDYLHRPVVIENIPFAGLIPALKTGKIDLIISSMTATPERTKSIDFSDSYLKTGLCLLVGAKSQVKTIAEADQPGRTIVVKQGTTGQTYAVQHLKKARVLVIDKETACVLEVTQGKADAFLYDQMSTFKNWQKNADTTQAVLEPFQQESWAIGFRKGDDSLRGLVNQFISTYRAHGGFDQLGDKWLAEQKEAFRARGIPFYF